MSEAAEPAAPDDSPAHDASERRLAAFMATLELGDVPTAVAAEAKLVLLDAIASALVGRQTAERPAVERLARGLAGQGGSTVIGGGSLAPIGAAFLNGYQVTSATICDVHRPTLCHVTPEVVPAVLATAQAIGASGADVLTATIAGLETTVRVATAFDDPTYRARGWHAPGIAGPFGAAAGAGRLLGLDGDGLDFAFGHAGGQAAGTFAALGTSAVKFHQARGAVSGLLAAHLAAAGLDAARDVLSARRGGLLRAYGDGGAPECLTDGLGETWRFLEISLRRWPGASSVQALVEAMLELAGPAGSRHVPASIRVVLPPRSFELSGKAGWGDQLSAFQSARYVAAVVAREGACWLEQFDPVHLTDPILGAFARDRVEVVAHGGIAPSGVSARVTFADGTSRTVTLDVPLGSPERRLGEDDVVAKLRRACLGPGLEERAGSIAAKVLDLEHVPRIADLLTLLTDDERTPAS